MTDEETILHHAYDDPEFLGSREARPLRILSEYVEPLSRFARHGVEDTIVFMGSARINDPGEPDPASSNEPLNDAAHDGTSRYYQAARELAKRLTQWSQTLGAESRRFVVCTGGGPGIMEAASRGASEVDGLNVGLTISISREEFQSKYVTDDLAFHFHYFFMRKFWFLYLAKAVVVFPGGYGTLDELFEILTLMQTGKVRKHLPIVLFGTEYWDEVINFDALVKHGTIDEADLQLFRRTDSVDDAYDYLVAELTEYGLAEPGSIL